MSSGLRQIVTEPSGLDIKASPSNITFEKSPRLNKKLHTERVSDSEQSAETNSLSAESNNDNNGRSPVKSTPSGLDQCQLQTQNTQTRKQRRRGAEWEIIDSCKSLQTVDLVPGKVEGFLLKKRKWPLKGWHKRFFILERGVLMYAKRPADLARGKPHGYVDLGLSVISAKKRRGRIDIDAEVFIYHIKVKSRESFVQWLDALKDHRQFRQYQLHGPGGDVSAQSAKLGVTSPSTLTPGGDLSPMVLPGSSGGGAIHVSTSYPNVSGGLDNLALPISREGSLMRSFKSSRANMLLAESSAALDQLNNDIVAAQERLIGLIKSAGAWSSPLGGPTPEVSSVGVAFPESVPPVTKSGGRRKFVLRRKKNKTAAAATGQDQSVHEPSASASVSESESGTVLVGSGGLGDKHSPLSCSIPSLSSSINGSSSATGLDLLHPSAPAGSVTSGGLEGGLASGSSVGSSNSATTPTVVIPLSPAGSAGSTLMIRGSDPIAHEFLSGAQDLIGRFTAGLRALTHERERLKMVVETVIETASTSSRGQAPNSTNNTAPASMVASLRCALQVALQQNAELRSRLQKIRSEAEVAIEGPTLQASLELDLNASAAAARLGHHSLSYSSSCVSQSEFFDAKEYLTDGVEAGGSDSSSDDASETEMEEEHDDGGSVSEASDVGNEAGLHDRDGRESPDEPLSMLTKFTTGRRTKLPCPKPSTEDLSLWNLMKRNIGKDLSKVSMPVVLNEPIGMLQRLSEELEYSELLDKAAEMEDPFERMVLIAAFAVSAYGSSHVRAGHKPFNPLLGETYECVREDKGFKYIGEQVSHHPPISACHATSRNFEFWQDIRIKTKFWGKSMEFQPLGTVNVRLPKYDDHYCWNKVTTCVHNLFGGQRWVDQYGDLIITNSRKGIRCKLNFAKASYWSSNRYEVVGAVTDPDGRIVHHLFGKWSEGLYCGVAPSARCVWRPGALPEDHELYYGFSRFAIELNDLEPSLIDILPHTDSRFRPDQRLLEEGNVPGAEASKLQLEQAQRERRVAKESKGEEHRSKWFAKRLADGSSRTSSGGDSEESDFKWEFTGSYWDVRAQSKFNEIGLDRLW